MESSLPRSNEAEVRLTILECISLDAPRSFYVYAGAGSGKTKSLVDCLNDCLDHYGERLRASSQRILVITYTNAACEEIQRRVGSNPLVCVSTIHSFAWDLISPYTADIKRWLLERLASDVSKLVEEISKQREGTKIALTRIKDVEKKKKRLEELSNVKKFTYSPSGDARSRNSLDHSEVLQMGAQFIMEKPLMQKILISGAPVLLIDESQDTNKNMMDSLLKVQANHGGKICLGLFGDSMQRIYPDGKSDLVSALPDDWKKPVKNTNYRSPKRIVSLINNIRSQVDDHKQFPRDDAPEGTVRFYIALSSSQVDRTSTESEVVQRMASCTGDPLWLNANARKTLTLEHHMAAKRLGFSEFFLTLYEINRIKAALLNGTLSELRFFTGDILMLYRAIKSGNKFAIAALLREKSPLLTKKVLKAAGSLQSLNLKLALEGVSRLSALWSDGADPSLYEILRVVSESRLLEIPERLELFCSEDGLEVQLPGDDTDAAKAELVAWRVALGTSFNQVISYDEYVNGLAAFGTHQGVKGLEFPRVLVVLDDYESGGNNFSYEKVFGIKPKTKSDIENEAEGKDTTILRTRRLLYVIASRAEESLAIIAYTENPSELLRHVVDQGMFELGEVELIC